MADFATFSPQDAREILRVMREIRASGILTSLGRGLPTFSPRGFEYVQNESGEEIPPFACMQMVGTAESGGQNYVEVNQPADSTGAAGGFVFNGPTAIEIGGKGVGFAGPVVRALGDGSAVSAGARWSPEASEWAITTDGEGLFTAVGGDDIATNVIKVQTRGGEGGGGGSDSKTRVAIVQTGGITARDGDTPGSGDVIAQRLTGGDFANDGAAFEVLNWVSATIPATAWVKIFYDDSPNVGAWFIGGEDCAS